MHWPKNGTTHYHAQLGLPDKGCTIEGLVVTVWPFGYYPLSPAVWFVCICVCLIFGPRVAKIIDKDRFEAVLWHILAFVIYSCQGVEG